MRRLASLIAALLLCVLLGACGQAGSSTTLTGGPSSTPQATATPTQPSVPSPIITSDPCEASGSNGSTSGAYVKIGDLLVSQVALVGTSYPSKMLPDDTAQKPLQLPDGQNLQNNFPSSPPTNPYVDEKQDGGYDFVVCNTSAAQSHVIQGVTVAIASFTAYTGQLNSWQFCDGFYTRAHGVFSGGCGGYFPYDEGLHAGFAPTDGPGASVSATQTSSGNGAEPSGTSVTPLPATLAPGKELVFLVGATLPSAPGRYGLLFSLTADNQPAAPISITTPALFAPVAHKWTGPACDTSAMLAQIPTAANPITYWICPGQ